MPWKVVAGSATGTAHTETGTTCQDAFHWCSHQDWLVALVSDGAGSARFSDVGAQHAARRITEELIYAITHELTAENRNSVDYWQERIRLSIEATRISLIKTQAVENCSLRDFHATIVGAVAGPEFGMFFQIGDGAAAAALTATWDNPRLSLPENGNYADETYFFTEECWQEHLRFTVFSPALNYITLVTDGAMSFVVASGRQTLAANFICPVTRYLENIDVETGTQALITTLDDPKTYAITSDDKTLLWAKRVD